TLTVDPSRDGRPPHPPVVQTPGIVEGFEEGTGTWSSSQALLLRDTTTAASGSGSLRVVNPAIGGSFKCVLKEQALDVGRLPLLRFAYRVPEEIRVGLGLANPQTTVGITFADPDDPNPRMGAIPDVKADGEWHRAAVNLREALLSLRWRADQFQVRDLSFADRGYQGAAPGASFWLDDVELIPAASGTAGITLSWSASDITGIQAYRYKWSTQAEDTPDLLLPGNHTQHTFQGVPEGLVYFHLQAQDRAGNWSPVTRVPFLVDNTPPRLGTPSPAPGKMSTALLALPLEDPGGSGVDPASVQAAVNGKFCPLEEFVASYDAAAKVLTWDWVVGSELFSEPIPDGAPIEIKIAPVKDFAGNAAEAITLSYTAHRAEDKEPPRAPVVQTPGTNVLCRETFTRSLGSWSPYSGNLSGLVRYLDPDRGDYCARVFTSGDGYGSTVWPEAFDAAQTPFVAFDYRCPPQVNLHLALLIGGTWYAVPLSGKSPSFTNVSAAPGFKADGQWHTIAFNYLDLLRAGGLKSPTVRVTLMALWHHGSPGGLVYDVDNFQVFGSGQPNLTLAWQAADPTGIHAYRCQAEPSPDAPDGGSETTERTATLERLKPGLWFIRVRARDGAGNWSAPALVVHHVGG
ncbi:MAG: hypothetical protein QHJ73_13235, partial [Armatimonadota bacterium]|nr:hypothetical protein [Armatimonadota bacterium]